MEAAVSVREPGRWTHQNVNAAGASFHVAVSGNGPHAVLLLHDFPLYWWQWRHQLPALADAGFYAVAMDLRGFGGSDYQPGDVHLTRLATDVTATVQSLGITSYSLVGAGMGGTIGWLVAHAGAPELRSFVSIGSPHPRVRGRSGGQRVDGHRISIGTGKYWKDPRRGPRQLRDGTLTPELLGRWSAPVNRERIESEAATYAEPMKRHFAAESAWETLEATRRIRAFERSAFEEPVRVPVMTIRGAEDPHCGPDALAGDTQYIASTLVHVEVPGSGHFVSEEQPERLTGVLLDHLERIPDRD